MNAVKLTPRRLTPTTPRRDPNWRERAACLDTDTDVTQTLSLSFADVAASLQRMHDALDWPPPLDACRQDSETVLEWKARHDDLRRRGLPRPPRRTGRAGRR